VAAGAPAGGETKIPGAAGAPAGGAPPPTTTTAAWLTRLVKDFADLDVPENVQLVTKRETQAVFSFVIKPQVGYWTGGVFEFKFEVPTRYPFEGPKVTCMDLLWHPNIDLDGGVCVSVLRPWKPTYTVQNIMFGLLFLLNSPNPDDPLNNEAAKQLRDDPVAFGKQVVKGLKGELTVTTKNGAGESRTTTFTRNKGSGFTGLPAT